MKRNYKTMSNEKKRLDNNRKQINDKILAMKAIENTINIENAMTIGNEKKTCLPTYV